MGAMNEFKVLDPNGHTRTCPDGLLIGVADAGQNGFCGMSLNARQTPRLIRFFLKQPSRSSRETPFG